MIDDSLISLPGLLAVFASGLGVGMLARLIRGLNRKDGS